MDILLTHASLLCHQLQRFLQTLGRKVLAMLMAAVMPVALWLGLAGQPGRTKADTTTQEPLLNLIYVGLPAEGYQEVPQPAASRRRGLWEKRRPDWNREMLLAVEAEISHSSSALPFEGFDGSLHTPPYQTILPNLDWDNWLLAHSL